MSKLPLTLKDDNKLLARITLVTGLGDFISLFAVLVLVHKLSGSVILAAYAVPVKSLGVGIGGLLLPLTLSLYAPRSLIVVTQWLSFGLMVILAVLSLYHVSSVAVLSILLLQTLLKQIFEGARESYSKSLGGDSEQRSLQAEILHGFFGAQAIGPVVSFFLLRNLPLQVPFLVDALSFLVAGALALQLTHTPKEVYERLSILRPFQYLGDSPGLIRIFLLRSVGYWIPVGIFNFLLFSVIQEHYNLDILHSAWVYAVIGVGSMISTTVLRVSAAGWLKRLREIPDGRLAAMALGVLAVTRVAFIQMPALWMALLFIGVGGVCNGINAVTTQSLRRKFTRRDQFPEIVGLELVVGRLVDWGVASLMFVALSRQWVSFASGMWISAAMLMGLAILHLDRRLLD